MLKIRQGNIIIKRNLGTRESRGRLGDGLPFLDEMKNHDIAGRLGYQESKQIPWRVSRTIHAIFMFFGRSGAQRKIIGNSGRVGSATYGKSPPSGIVFSAANPGCVENNMPSRALVWRT
jgi:hypothetical protein